MAYYPDISHWKPVSDWEAVAKNCPFMISKATEGTHFVDSYLQTFVRKCEQYHIPYWLYTFLNAGNERAQAEYMVKICNPIIGPFFRGYVLDVESNNPAKGVQEALDYIKTQSEKTILYTMYAQYAKYLPVIMSRGERCAWWEARYGANTGSCSMPCHVGADLHQYTSKGVCPGIGANTDLNRLTGTKEEAWFTGKAKPEPEPVIEEDEMQGLIKEPGKSAIYYYNIEAKVMFWVPDPDCLRLLMDEYKRAYGKDIKTMDSSKFNTLKKLIKGKSV